MTVLGYNVPIMHNYLEMRRQKLIHTLKNNRAPNVLISNPLNVAYLTGQNRLDSYEREAFLLIADTKIILISTVLSQHKFNSIPGLEHRVLSRQNSLSQIIKDYLKRTTVYFEADDITYQEYTILSEKTGKKWRPINNFIAQQRSLKDELEIKAIKEACTISSRAWNRIQDALALQTSEKDLVKTIISIQEDLGADAMPYAFQPMVSFGTHTSHPHHQPTHRLLSKNDPVMVDFGADKHGYASDFTRTITFGQTSSRFKQVEKVVLEVYNQVTQQLRPGISFYQLHQIAVKHFKHYNYQDNFTHAIGHGIGLELHEYPHVTQADLQENILEPNMVVTIEPGLYFDGQLGYRHENTIRITESGYEVLTESS